MMMSDRDQTTDSAWNRPKLSEFGRMPLAWALAAGLLTIGLWFGPGWVRANSQADKEAELRQQLVGTWKILSASFDGKPSELHQNSITLKHVTPVHVQWIGYQPEDRKIFRSAGGSWTIRDGRYVETMRYGLDEQFKANTFGKEFAFDCRFEEDRWIQSGRMPGGVELIEIWQRVRPDEDVSQRPKSK